jgi:hypothetical protein
MKIIEAARTRILFSLAAVLLATAPAFSAERTIEKSIPLPGHGTFKLSVPAAWTVEVIQKERTIPPSIALRPAKGKGFEVVVAPIWRPRPDVPLPTRQSMQEQLMRNVEYIQPQAVEQQIGLVEFQGKTGPGMYFVVTDKAPTPQGYKYMMQGLLSVSELLVVVTALSNESKEKIVRELLPVLRSASHEP